ncbi:DUF488 domain-containing protein [Fimbriimonas ginsengisoli]|uniref:DUF488 domain-containing protein n=1 Tax=Fimbriimonas ginsengisoli Gsoil 348 TaxID=661478 RepID=A0A068NQ30_FIMGI|nr:DUF488 domain-containing protein [Fimbriimonas ginsengisoli]AIE83709.1 hypothetical protein OP10G_0341 [Fimbriimonas ginsengisoli Gsoil 348]
MAEQQIFTIGVYGTTEALFFESLVSHGVTHFVDVRRRRGLRGHEYAYGNSNALQARLATLGIEYVHRIDLSPTDEIRTAQLVVDAASGTSQRAREHLSDEFVERYRSQVLAGFDANRFLGEFPEDARLVLFCVEGHPDACHRSILATEIETQSGRSWRDITQIPN